jgi:hypothetical protein
MIESGAMKLRDAVSEVRQSLSAGSLTQVSELFNLVVTTAYTWQKSGQAKKLKEQYLQEHKEVATELTFGEAKE